MPTSETGEPKRLYERRLPSGGYVAIQVSPVRTFFGRPKVRGEVIVERREPARRVGHRPPIVAVTERDDAFQAAKQLVAIARSDELLADVLSRKVIATVTAGRKLQS